MKRMRFVVFLSLLLTGCSSGRVGSIHSTDHALVFGDNAYPGVSILQNNKVKRLGGHFLVPMNPSGRYLVVEDECMELRWIKIGPDKPNTIRLLLPANCPRFRWYDLVSGSTESIPSPPVQRDEQIGLSYVDGDRFAVEVGSCYSAGPGSDQRKYFARQLPKGSWVFIDGPAWEKFKIDATSRLLEDEAIKSGKLIDRWGTIVEQHDAAGWKTILKRPGGEEITLLEQNDGGYAERASQAVRVSGPIWP